MKRGGGEQIGKMEKNRNMGKDDIYNYIITEEQKSIICRYFGKDSNDMEDWEISELLDKVIDDLKV